jgi:magnesium transporter
MNSTRDLSDVRIDQAFLADRDSVARIAAAISACLSEGEIATLRRFFDAHEPADNAVFLQHLRPDEALAAMRHLDVADQASAFGYFDASHQGAIAELMPRRELAELMSAMSHDERADLYNRLSEQEREALLPGLAQAEREDLRRLASYPEGSAGSVMTSDYAALKSEFTAAEAIDALRLQAPDSETIYKAFIVDDERRLVGSVSLRELLLAKTGECVADLMDRDPVFVRADAPREEAAQLIARYDLIALPVVNGGDKLAGIVTPDDAMDVAAEEATEDFHRVGTVQRLPGSIRRASLFVLYRARIFWLLLLVFGNIFSGMGIAHFEDTIAAHVALVFFLPLLIDSGGNAGSQSATLMVRAIATGDVRTSDWASMLGRELGVALLLGVSMAVAVSTLGIIRGGPEIALVVSLSMVIIVVVGSMIGMSLPFILHRFRMDPATASAPLVTSIADASGVLIYFSIATQVLALPAA